MPATIKDVARHAGVSTAAVSYVLNGRDTAVRITPETRERILAAARDLRYHPNALARGLAQKRTDTVALVMQFASIFSGWTGFTSELMRGATESAIQLGFDLMLHTKDQQTVDQEVQALRDGRVDGALLLRDRDDPLAARLTESRFPCVLFFVRSESPDVWFVDCDNVLGGRMATDYLLDLGHRSIFHLTGPSGSGAAQDRRQGYESALLNRSLPVRPEWVVPFTESDEDARNVAAILTGPDRPTAAFAWSDDEAVRLLTCARGLGLKVPGDLSLIGFDSTDMCDHVSPPLTSVRQPIYDMTSLAFKMLSHRIKGESVPNPHVLFTPEITVRSSCGPAPDGRPNERR